MPRVLALAVLILCTAVPWVAGLAQDQRGLGRSTDVKACINCHDVPAVTSILHTAHAPKADPRTGVAEQGCENCHGVSEDHMARVPEGQTRPPPEHVFSGPKASPVAQLNEVCAGCHSGGTVLAWTGSQHHTADVACSSCHASHPTDDPMLVKTAQADTCFSCHAEQRAQSLRPSHHPVREGIMTCSDCHNPHGSAAPHLMKAATINDTCYACHDEKRGPFLWEHAPVMEQCTICHTPHGAVQPALLRQRTPYLCQNCHDSTLHNSQPFSATNLPTGSFPGRQMTLRGCLNCHSQVHGSNHPSGIRFGR
jgi:DmsE family decaheme c-type cytochrome